MDATITRIGDAIASDDAAAIRHADSARGSSFVEITRFDSVGGQISAFISPSGLSRGGAAA